MLDVFIHFCQLDYVGSIVINSNHATQDVCKEISKLKQEVTQRNGRKVTLTPDELFDKFLYFIPELPNDASLWTLQLGPQYYNGLTEEIRDKMIDDGFTMPLPGANATKSSELHRLRTIRLQASTSYKRLMDNLRLVERYLSNRSHSSRGNANFIASDFDNSGRSDIISHNQHHAGSIYFQSNSPAEQTLKQHHGNESNFDVSNYVQQKNPDNLPVKRLSDGMLYPFRTDDPNYISKFPLGFRGCYICGASNHFSRSNCPTAQKGQFDKNAFFRELWIHKPKTKKSTSTPDPSKGRVNMHGTNPYGPEPTSLSTNSSVANPQPQSILRGSRQDNRPAWMTHPKEDGQDRKAGEKMNFSRFDRAIVDEGDFTNNKVGRAIVCSARLLLSNGPNPSVRPMPLGLDNGLPGTLLRLGADSATQIGLFCHIDSCAAMNTGNLLAHQYLMSTYPETVLEYTQHNDTNPFQPIRLISALDDSLKPSVDTGHLTAIVRYRTPYTDINDKPVILSFGLGKDVSVRAIIGIPQLKEWGACINLVENILFCGNLFRKIPLDFEVAKSGLPDGVQFSPEEFKRPSPSTITELDPTTTVYHSSADACGITDGSRFEEDCAVVTDTTERGILRRHITTNSE